MSTTAAVSAAEQNFKADHRKIVREFELERVLRLFPAGATILEIGAGAGWQAKQLADRGYKVTAIDIAQSRYSTLQEWNVIDYDGHHIPLPDQSVDVIFSSNVLEHIPHIDEFMVEMRRVLRPGGVAVHVMPTTLWRFITTGTFYVQRFQMALNKFRGESGAEKGEKLPEHENSGAPARGIVEQLRRAALPTCHGVRGTVISELYYFSKGFWMNTFRSGGWSVAATEGAGLIYSGYRVFGHGLPLAIRKKLAKIFGSSCRIYRLPLEEIVTADSRLLWRAPRATLRVQDKLRHWYFLNCSGNADAFFALFIAQPSAYSAFV